MLWWGILWGAIIGSLIGPDDGIGLLFGAVIGAAAGGTLRRAIRAEIARAVAKAGDRTLPIPATAVVRPADPVQAAERRPPIAETVGQPTPPPAPLTPPPPPPRPSIVATAVEAGLTAARNWLLGGNLIVRVGLVILFVGLSFLASYAASEGLFPIELRLMLVVLAGIALLAVGFRSRQRRPAFALALQGAGVAAIYLTLFAATRLYGLLPPVPAFALMIAVCALGCALALLQNSQGLAVAAFAGGFAVPMLLPGGGGGAALPFVYFTILNLGLLFIAWRRSWRVLNLIGFFATFGIAGLFGMGASVTPALYPTAQAFLIVSVLIYVLAGAFYARNTPGRLGKAVDGTLLFGPALAGFGLQVALVHDRPYGAAFSALGFAALYIAVATGTARRRQQGFGLLHEGLLAIAIGFLTLAVPLALGAQWTSAAWAIEGAGAVWLGMRQARWLPRLFGLALQAVATLLFVVAGAGNVAAIPFANAGFTGAMLVALPLLASAWWLRRPAAVEGGSRLAAAYAGIERRLARPVFLTGFLMWWLAWGLEATRRLPPAIEGGAQPFALAGHLPALLTMLAYVASAAAFDLLGRRRGWAVAQWPGRVTLVALAVTFLSGIVFGGHHLLDHPDWIVWTAAIALHFRLLYLADRAEAPSRITRAGHVGGVWLGAAMLADCLFLGIDRGGLWDTSWAAVVFLAAGVAILLGLTRWAGPAMRGAARRWPVAGHAADYGWYAAAPLAALVVIDTVGTALLASGAVAPLPYVPLLNPVDLSLAFALVTLLLWRRAVVAAVPAPRGSGALRGHEALAPLAGLAFIVVNSVWLRIAHHYLGVAWNGEALLGSFAVQTGLAILWTLLALALMIWAHRQGNRVPWIVGAGLLGLTVVKLLLIDLNNAGGGARIVTFLVVGVLMLVVGYFVPLPPRARTETQEAPAS